MKLFGPSPVYGFDRPAEAPNPLFMAVDQAVESIHHRLLRLEGAPPPPPSLAECDYCHRHAESGHSCPGCGAPVRAILLAGSEADLRQLAASHLGAGNAHATFGGRTYRPGAMISGVAAEEIKAGSLVHLTVGPDGGHVLHLTRIAEVP